jgi:uncharacterized protein YpmB
MPIKSLEERKKQNLFLIIGAAIIIVGLIILYFAFWQKRESSSENQAVAETRLILSEQKLQKADLDFDFLANKMLTFLKSHGNLPVQKGAIGKINPFSP